MNVVIVLTMLILPMAGFYPDKSEYMGKTRNEFILLLEQKHREGEKIFIGTKARNSLFCHTFDSADEIRKKPFVMSCPSWDIFPRKKWLNDGAYCTRLLFEDNVVVSVIPDVGYGFGGPLPLFLMWFYSHCRSASGG